MIFVLAPISIQPPLFVSSAVIQANLPAVIAKGVRRDQIVAIPFESPSKLSQEDSAEFVSRGSTLATLCRSRGARVFWYINLLHVPTGEAARYPDAWLEEGISGRQGDMYFRPQVAGLRVAQILRSNSRILHKDGLVLRFAHPIVPILSHSQLTRSQAVQQIGLDPSDLLDAPEPFMPREYARLSTQNRIAMKRFGSWRGNVFAEAFRNVLRVVGSRPCFLREDASTFLLGEAGRMGLGLAAPPQVPLWLDAEPNDVGPVLFSRLVARSKEKISHVIILSRSIAKSNHAFSSSKNGIVFGASWTVTQNKTKK